MAPVLTAKESEYCEEAGGRRVVRVVMVVEAVVVVHVFS